MRVYYEDTDFSGVVYHANYLRFFERARTEWLRSLGCDAASLKREHGLAMALRHMEIDFLRPARMDDMIEISVALAHAKRAHFVLEQEARIEGEPIARTRVQVACVACEGFAPRAIPGFLLEKLGASVKNP
ncbi:MAG: tol-pal system-associated acyl-CoA thioesterase [Betaproteobacteria bacterium]|nr:tol-pal system-associated acyl-CoA thioesterase [Betaproteobacteria bacterium]